MRRRLMDTTMSVRALAVLALALVSIDTRVREHVVRIASGTSVRDAGVTIADLGSVVMLAARDQTLSHAPLAIFVVAAAVLVVFMLRT